jgi:hypothetical protein
MLVSLLTQEIFAKIVLTETSRPAQNHRLGSHSARCMSDTLHSRAGDENTSDESVPISSSLGNAAWADATGSCSAT